MSRYILSALVENRAGVLSRISGLFTRRGYNIDSLSVAETENPRVSRMTISVRADEAMAEQIKKQIEKQVDVLEVEEMGYFTSVVREHVLIKIAAAAENRLSVIAVADIFRANVIDVSPETMMIELTGDTTKVDAFVEVVRPFGIRQVVRSGVTALRRG